VGACSAIAIERAPADTLRPRAATSASDAPRAAAAPQIFSTAMTAAVPRRPGPSSLSVATSSSTSTVSTSATAISAAIPKFMTSPV
jgi:hypothetical protein